MHTITNGGSKMLTLKQFLIVCPMCFLAGFVDSIGGGGGLISLPAFMLAGLPVHLAVGTNKVHAFMSCSMSTLRMAKKKLVVPSLAVCSAIGAVIGSVSGAKLNLIADEKLLSWLSVLILPLCAFIIFRKNLIGDDAEVLPEINAKNLTKVLLISLAVGIYDGFWGPGAGTFLIIGFCTLAGMGASYANGQAKVANLATSFSSMCVYLMNGQSLVPLGIAAGVCAMAGSYIGSGLMFKNGTKIVRPIIVLVISLLMLKIILGF